MKKLLILFVLVTIFSCSDDEKPEPVQEQEPLVTKVNLRIEDENGLTFSDIQGDFFKDGTEVPMFDNSSWQNVLIDIESYEDFETNLSFANQIGFVDSSGTSAITIDTDNFFQNTNTETIYFSTFSSIAGVATNNFVSVSITEGETLDVTLVAAIDFTKFEN